MYYSSTGKLGFCDLAPTQLSPGLQPGVFQGVLRGDWLSGAFENGSLVRGRRCFEGPVHHVQISSFSVFVGARSGNLMGRWLFLGS